MAAPKSDDQSRLVTQNRRARFDYFIEDTLEAGLVLLGSEVKSVRAGHAVGVDSRQFRPGWHVPAA